MLKHKVPELDAKGLRKYGLMMAGFIAGLLGLVFPWVWDISYPVWPWVAGGVFLVWSLASPASLRPVYMGWMRMAMAIGGMINYIVLSAVFYMVMLPIGLVMRAMGRDPMVREFDENSDTYRVISKQANKNHMERPF